MPSLSLRCIPRRSSRSSRVSSFFRCILPCTGMPKVWQQGMDSGTIRPRLSYATYRHYRRTSVQYRCNARSSRKALGRHCFNRASTCCLRDSWQRRKTSRNDFKPIGSEREMSGKRILVPYSFRCSQKIAHWKYSTSSGHGFVVGCCPKGVVASAVTVFSTAF